MTISKKNLTVIIVSFKSNYVIHKCLSTINQDIKVIVVDNANDKTLKKELEAKYDNVDCILSSQNLGMGAGNNLGIKNVLTDYALILNPDVFLYQHTIDELLKASEKIKDFSIISPISNKINNPNYTLFKNQNFDNQLPFEVISVDGFAMLFNLKKLKKLEGFNFFDENIFLYLENDDICKELRKRNQKIYVVPSSKVDHGGGFSVDPIFKYEIELSRNWHWMWSKFYFNKKHYGYFFAVKKTSKNLLSSFCKYLFYLFTFNRDKRNVYWMRLCGLIASMKGKKSYYRPNF